ncbi:MAG: glycosyltransferase [Candidatus Freyarchaeota archaeon]
MISVVIPSLNEAEFIGRCLESLTRQTVPPDEIILVDAGSVDGTVEIARRYVDKIIVSPKADVVLQRNLGAQEAKGDIIVSTDADTVAASDWIERLTSHFVDPSVVAAGGYNERVNQAEDWNLSGRLGKYGKTVYDPEAMVWTDIPLNRQAEFAGLATSAGVLGLGAYLNKPVLAGLGLGYIGTEAFTLLFEEPSPIHHSHMAVAGLALLALFHETFKRETLLFLAGLFDGMLIHHFLTEDITSPWMRVNGPLATGINLLLVTA